MKDAGDINQAANAVQSDTVNAGSIWQAKSPRKDGTRKQIVVVAANKQTVAARSVSTGTTKKMRRNAFLISYAPSNKKADDGILWGEADAGRSVVVGPEMRKLKKALDQQPRALIINIIWTLTPSLGAELVATAEGRNRNSTESRIKLYKQDQGGGNWVTTHQGVAVGPDMDLVDGEHRCRTVMVTGVECDVQVSQYTSREHCEVARKNLDGQLNRTKAHVLEIDGLVERGKGKAVAATIDAMRHVDVRVPKDLTKTQLEDVFKVRKKSIAAVLSKVNKDFHSGVRAGLVIAHMCAPEKIEQLVTAVVTHVDIKDRTAAQVMAKRLPRLQRGGSKEEVVGAIVATLAICYIHVRGKSVPKPNKNHESIGDTHKKAAIAFFLGDHFREPTVEPDKAKKKARR